MTFYTGSKDIALILEQNIIIIFFLLNYKISFL